MARKHLRVVTDTVVFGYLGEHNLYIPTRENVRLDLYQSQSLRVQYTCPVGWSLDAAQMQRLDEASRVTPPYPYYPYWNGQFGERNPPLV